MLTSREDINFAANKIWQTHKRNSFKCFSPALLLPDFSSKMLVNGILHIYEIDIKSRLQFRTEEQFTWKNMYFSILVHFHRHCSFSLCARPPGKQHFVFSIKTVVICCHTISLLLWLCCLKNVIAYSKRKKKFTNWTGRTG